MRVLSQGMEEKDSVSFPQEAAFRSPVKSNLIFPFIPKLTVRRVSTHLPSLQGSTEGGVTWERCLKSTAFLGLYLSAGVHP